MQNLKKPGSSAASAIGSGGPLKPKAKIRRKSGASGDATSPKNGTAATADSMDIENDLDELEETTVSVRVRDRAPGSPEQARPKSRLGMLFRDPSPASIKESIKRPLSGLLKRPGSRSGGKGRKDSALKDNELVGVELEDGVTVGGQKTAAKKPNWFGSESSRAGSAAPRKSSFTNPKRGVDGAADLADAVEGAITTTTLTRGVDDPTESRRGSTPDIPNLEEVHGAEFGTNIAQAPSIAVNKVATYRELDNELMKQTAFASLGDIDLSLLTRFLCPETEVRDEEVPWTWDYLYTGICSELRSEWEEADDEADAEENHMLHDHMAVTR